MKTKHLPLLLTTALGFAVLSTVGCAGKEKTAANVTPSTKNAVTPALPTIVPASWASIKDHTYDMRAQFVAGLVQLEAQVNEQTASLKAQRAAMKSTTETQSWDTAMKEMGDAQSALKSSVEELNKATAETWSQAKDKVGQAWLRTQDAFAKVKASTTG